jgi:hypothetical protein
LDGGLCHTVGTDAGHSDIVGGAAADGDDASPIAQLPRRRLNADKGCANVHRYELFESFEREAIQRRRPQNAGIVHEDVETAECLRPALHDLLQFGGRTAVRPERQ